MKKLLMTLILSALIIASTLPTQATSGAHTLSTVCSKTCKTCGGCYCCDPCGWCGGCWSITSCSACGTTITYCTDDAKYISQSVPTEMRRGETALVSVTFKNVGTGHINWTTALNYRLGSQNPDNNMIWGLNRVDLGSSDFISPGTTKTFSFMITAPGVFGSYNFQWRMLKEGAYWFGEKSPNVVIKIRNHDPIGAFDTADCNVLTGWTCDWEDYSQPIDVHFYANNPAGSGGTFIGSVTADANREPAIAAHCGGYSNHGFSFPLPGSLMDGKSHKIYAYAINIPSGNNPLLAGSPKTVNKCTPTTTIATTSTTTSSTSSSSTTSTSPTSSSSTSSTSTSTTSSPTSSTTTTTLYTRPVTLKYNVTDDHATKFNCSLWTNVSGNWKIEQTNTNINKLETQYFVLNNVPEGTYGWTANCTDGTNTPSSYPYNAYKTTPTIPNMKYWTFNVKTT